MTDKEKEILVHLKAIKKIMETDPNWSGYLSMAIMDGSGAIACHNLYYDADAECPVNFRYVEQMKGREFIRRKIDMNNENEMKDKLLRLFEDADRQSEGSKG